MAQTTGKRVIRSNGASNQRIPSGWLSASSEWLHCVSAYPAPIEDLNLKILSHSCAMFAGYSDHSRDIDMGGFAVCAGAKIIEAHLRLYDCASENPDYPAAFDPGEFAHYVAKIRKAERALGSGVKAVQPSERWALEYRVTA